MGESAQKILSRVRPPRVQITYDVDTGDAIEKKTLPFIVGILADLAGDEDQKVEPSLKAREFIQIDRENFDGVMKSLAPKFVLEEVKYVIPDGTMALPSPADGTKIFNVPLTLMEMDDLTPLSLAKNIPEINLPYQTQCHLQDLLGKMDGNDGLINLLDEIILNKQNKEVKPDKIKDPIEKEKAEFSIEDKVESLKAVFASATLGDLLKESALAEVLADPDRTNYVAGDNLIKVLKPISYQAKDDRKPKEYIKYENDLAIQKAAWEAFDPVDNVVLKLLLSKNHGAMILDNEQKAYAYKLICQFTIDILGDTSSSASSDKDGGSKKKEKKKDKAGKADAEADKSAEAESVIDVATRIVNKVDKLKEAITDQLNAVMHHDKFQEIEGAWRGLRHLVFSTETSTTLKLKLLVASEKELKDDLKKAVEFDQSALFKKVYENEYGTYGGEPFSMLVADFYFGRGPEQMEFLEKLSALAAQAHTPLIAPASSKLFDMKNFTDLAKPRDLSKIFESAELVKWRSFRDSEDSRYVTLTLPQVMLRYPYGSKTIPADNIDFEENVDGSVADDYLWGNSAYFLTERITNAFAKYGWTAAIRGVEGGGLVEGLPAHVIKTSGGDEVVRCPTQISITDRREKELNDLGFVSLCHRKGWDQAAFFGGQTANKPTKYNTDSANMNASVSAMLPYMLNASRFAHYIKVIMREKVGSFQTRSSIEEYLNTWITQYVLLDESAGQESKAAYPLQQGRVVVTEVPGRPGVYKAVVFLRPHFQLEELSASIRLVADIPS